MQIWPIFAEHLIFVSKPHSEAHIVNSTQQMKEPRSESQRQGTSKWQSRHPNPGPLTPKFSPHPTTSYNHPALSATEVICCLFTVRNIGTKAELGQSRGWSRMVLRNVSIRWNRLQGNLAFLDTNVGEESSKSFLSSLKLFLKQGQK